MVYIGACLFLFYQIKKMKKIILFLFVLTAASAAFAQKSKSVPPKADTAYKIVYTCSMHPDVISDTPGVCPKCNMTLTASKKEQMKQEVTHTYTCPMHPEVVSDHAGICAKCNSKLVVDRTGTKKSTTVYACSMHKDVVSNKEGKCPICGAELAAAKPKGKS
jgi:putative DNA topoisomerase